MASEYLLLLEHRQAALGRLAEFHANLGKPACWDASARGPLLDKAGLRESFDRLTALGPENRPLWWKQTSGTSGAAIRIPYSAEFYLDLKYAVFHKAWRLAWGAPLGREPYLAMVLTDMADEAGSIAIDPLFNNGVVARLPLDVSSQQTLKATLRLLRTHRPRIVSTKPSVLAALLSVVEEPVLLAPLSLIIVGGAALAPDLRRRAEQVFGARVISLYATSELGVLASECEQHRLHVLAHEVTLFDDHPEAPGQIIATNLRNRALPLRDYQTGDRGQISAGDCSCGARWPWVEQLDGRVVPLFRFADGSVCSPTRFNRFLDVFHGISEFQLELRNGAVLRVRVQPVAELTGDQSDDIREFFRREVPPQTSIEIEVVAFPPHEKFARYRVVE